MAGVLSHGSHFRAGDGEAKRTVIIALPPSLASAWFADQRPALLSETAMHSMRGTRFRHSKKLKSRRNHSEAIAPEFPNVKKTSLVSNSFTDYFIETAGQKKHRCVHACLGGHPGMGKRKVKEE